MHTVGVDEYRGRSLMHLRVVTIKTGLKPQKRVWTNTWFIGRDFTSDLTHFCTLETNRTKIHEQSLLEACIGIWVPSKAKFEVLTLKEVMLSGVFFLMLMFRGYNADCECKKSVWSYLDGTFLACKVNILKRIRLARFKWRHQNFGGDGLITFVTCLRFFQILEKKWL